MSRRTTWLGLIVFLAAIVIMGRLGAYDFTDWDDRYTIAQNPRLNPPTWDSLNYYWRHGEFGLYVPGTYTIWALLAKLAWVDVPDDQGYQLNPWIFHSANVLFHAVAAVVVYAVLRRCVAQPPSAVEMQATAESQPGAAVPHPVVDVAACFGAALFAVHPVQVESVGWVSGMKDVLCGLFSLVALWQYVSAVQAQSKRQRWTHFSIATAAFVWALLCKPAAMVVPAIALVLDWLVLRNSLRRAAAATALWWPIAIAWMFVTRGMQPTFGLIGAPLWQRPLVALDAMAFYLWKIVWPIGLGVDYGRTPAVALDRGWLWWTWIVPVAVAAQLAWLRDRVLIAAAFVLVIAVAPVLGFVPFLFQHFTTVADHYLYLAMLGPALALAWIIVRWDSRRVRAIACIALVLLAMVSMRQAGAWRNDQTLFARTIQVNPDSFLAHNNLAGSLLREADLLRNTEQGRQRLLEARDMYTRAIELRQKVNRGKDDYFLAHLNLASTLERLGDWDSANQHRLRALEIVRDLPAAARPNINSVTHQIARNYMMMQHWDDALRWLNLTLQADPQNRAAADDRQLVLEMMRKPPG